MLLPYKKLLKRLSITLFVGWILLYVAFIIYNKSNNYHDQITFREQFIFLLLLAFVELFFEFYFHLFKNYKKRFLLFNTSIPLVFLCYYLITPYPFHFESNVPWLLNLILSIGLNKIQYFERSQKYFTPDYLEKAISLYVKDKQMLKYLISKQTKEINPTLLDTTVWPNNCVKNDALQFGATKIICSSVWDIFFDKNNKVVLTRYMSHYLKTCD